MHRIFAFGTLKRGFPLHEKGLLHARYCGEHLTVQRFPMLVAGPWFAPMMIDQPGTGLRVKGELYEIDDAQLVVLDALESIGQPGNFRRLLEMESLAGGETCMACAYLKSAELAVPAHTGFLTDYQDRRFIPPERRQ
jgi:gamma-glutamylaminecyclotransferase